MDHAAKSATAARATLTKPALYALNERITTRLFSIIKIM
jgi:hypothetical protein